MKVIFKNTGEVKDVSFGYAVNYLLPKGLAVAATAENLRALTLKKLKEQEKAAQENRTAARLFSQFSGKLFTIAVKAGKKGKLYGALTKKELAKQLKVPKEAVILPAPIKKVGEYELELKFASKRAKIKLRVEAEDDNQESL
jgi:large subunit ribosomal protein L9